jgi:hypothetical protein
MEQYYKILGELYLNTRIALEEAEQKIAQKDALIEHLKAENFQLKKGVVEHGTMGT